MTVLKIKHDEIDWLYIYKRIVKAKSLSQYVNPSLSNILYTHTVYLPYRYTMDYPRSRYLFRWCYEYITMCTPYLIEKWWWEISLGICAQQPIKFTKTKQWKLLCTRTHSFTPRTPAENSNPLCFRLYIIFFVCFFRIRKFDEYDNVQVCSK